MGIEKIRQFTVDEGYEARGYGIPFSRNPYIPLINPVSWESWNQGWKEHEEEYPDALFTKDEPISVADWHSLTPEERNALYVGEIRKCKAKDTSI